MQAMCAADARCWQHDPTSRPPAALPSAVLPLRAAAVSVLLPLPPPPGSAARSRRISYSFDFRLSSKNLVTWHVGQPHSDALRCSVDAGVSACIVSTTMLGLTAMCSLGAGHPHWPFTRQGNDKGLQARHEGAVSPTIAGGRLPRWHASGRCQNYLGIELGLDS